MTTRGNRIREIQKEERIETASRIEALEVPPQIKDGIMSLFMFMQDALNRFVNETDRVMDNRVAPLTLRTMADEMERAYRRLQNERLAMPVEDDNDTE